MPVATQATVKALTPQQILNTGTEAILANAYHLYLRPGADVIARAQGIHQFMRYSGTIITDSGGFQVFSLAKLVKVTDEGVQFRSHIDGSLRFLTPRDVMEIQEKLSADIWTCLDECVPYPCDKDSASHAVERTLRWAKECKQWRDGDGEGTKFPLFGIVQGGFYEDLRIACAEQIVEMDFDGYALGGFSVGEPRELRREILSKTAERLPREKIIYLMGLGMPDDIIDAVSCGVDLFDCVLPTRNARNALLFTRRGKLRILNEAYKEDFSPIEEGCDCYACGNFMRAYLRHLFVCKEILGSVLATIHNIRYFQRLMSALREEISTSGFDKAQFLASWWRED
jgi:queuine tRNA-ribosyltransferase